MLMVDVLWCFCLGWVLSRGIVLGVLLGKERGVGELGLTTFGYYEERLRDALGTS